MISHEIAPTPDGVFVAQVHGGEDRFNNLSDAAGWIAERQYEPWKLNMPMEFELNAAIIKDDTQQPILQLWNNHLAGSAPYVAAVEDRAGVQGRQLTEPSGVLLSVFHPRTTETVFAGNRSQLLLYPDSNPIVRMSLLSCHGLDAEELQQRIRGAFMESAKFVLAILRNEPEIPYSTANGYNTNR